MSHFYFGVNRIALEYDAAYGPDKMRGWTVHSGGGVLMQFKPFWRAFWQFVGEFFRKDETR